MDFDSKVKQWRSEIDIALDGYVPLEEKATHHTLLKAMRYSLLHAGKRIRPILCLAFAELAGGSVSTALPFACAIEMVHTYSLIHDDLPCMDNDVMRRGKPTCHVAFGEDIAVLAGDALLTHAFSIILSVQDQGISAQNKVDAGYILAAFSGKDGMIGGQCIDIESKGKAVEDAILLEMDQGKTVALIAAACQLGCIAAGANQEQMSAAYQYAHGLGMAFQIRDDVLGVTGDAVLLGKSVGIDAESKKSNYVSLFGLEKAQELVESYTKQAIEALGAFSKDSSFLHDLTKWLAQRMS